MLPRRPQVAAWWSAALLAISSAGWCAAPAAAPSAGELPPATLITMDLNWVPEREAFVQLSKVSGIDIAADSENLWKTQRSAPITMKFDRQSFWAVMWQLCSKVNVTLANRSRADGRLRLREGGWGEDPIGAPASVNGAFMVCLQTIVRDGAVDMLQPQDLQRSLRLNMLLLAEPKVKLLKFCPQAVIEQAVDEEGRSLVRPDEELLARRESKQQIEQVAALLAGLKSRRLERCRGYVLVVVQGADPAAASRELKVPFEFRDLDLP